MYYKAKVNNLTPTGLDAPIFEISRDEKGTDGWHQVECRESHELWGKLLRVNYDKQNKYPKVELWIWTDDGNIVIFKSSLWKTIRSVLYKLSAPETIDKILLKANWFDAKQPDGTTKVVRYVSVFVDGQKWDNPFNSDDERIRPVDVQSNWKHFAWDYSNVDAFVVDTLIPQIQSKLINQQTQQTEQVEVKEHKNENPKDVLPF